MSATENHQPCPQLVADGNGNCPACGLPVRGAWLDDDEAEDVAFELAAAAELAAERAFDR